MKGSTSLDYGIILGFRLRLLLYDFTGLSCRQRTFNTLPNRETISFTKESLNFLVAVSYSKFLNHRPVKTKNPNPSTVTAT